MTTQPEALRHADKLDAHEFDEPHGVAAELRRLSEIETLYLAAMRGRHAMSEELLALTAQRHALLEALKGITPPMPPADAPCHVGLVPQEKCAHCGRIARARAAIKAVEEGK